MKTQYHRRNFKKETPEQLQNTPFCNYPGGASQDQASRSQNSAPNSGFGGAKSPVQKFVPEPEDFTFFSPPDNRATFQGVIKRDKLKGTNGAKFTVFFSQIFEDFC